MKTTLIALCFQELLPEYTEGGRIGNLFLPTMGGISIILALCTALLAVGMLLWMNSSSGKGRELTRKSLFPAFVSVWLFGFMVYDIGMYTGEPISLLTNVPMVVLNAFGMFLLNSDISAILGPFRNNWFFMCCYSLAHFAAAMVSMLFVIKHFGFNIIAAMRRGFTSRGFSKKKKTTYLFWGLNDATYHLAKSIVEHHGIEHDYRIIVVRYDTDKDKATSINGMERLFNFLAMNNEELLRLRSLDCLTASTFVGLPDLFEESEDAPSDIFGAMGLKWVSRILLNRMTGDVHVFFMSDDKTENMQAVAILKKDTTLAAVMRQPSSPSNDMKQEEKSAMSRKVTFYCRARYNSYNRVMEDLDVSNGIDVHIIDPSRLSVECLKREVRHQPICFVDIDKEKNVGTVKTPFTSLIVGFGDTGKDALRFLYEYGAFVDANSTDTTLRSPFHCHVVDQQLDHIKGPFINSAPAIFASTNPSDGSPLVQMHNIYSNTDEFYNVLLKDIADTLNYVVIAVGEDEAGMTLAVRILKYLRRRGRDFSHLRLFVRSYDMTLYPQLLKTAQHYNEKEERIVVFGKNEELFTYDMIVGDEFEQRGKSYYEAYRALNPEHDGEGSWAQRKRKLKGLSKLSAIGTDPNTGARQFEETMVEHPQPALLDNLQKLRRKETQDRSNALHEATKIKILESVFPDWYNSLVPKLFDIPSNASNTFVRIRRQHIYDKRPIEIRYPELSPKEQMLMDNLAKTEHMRWNASHEVLGYTKMPDSVPDGERGCDERRVTHNCLVTWEQLDGEADRIDYINDYKIFDYSVVETTINIHRISKERST